MNRLTLHTEYDCQNTIVSNIFIDKYMASANGEFVKIYLYLLRCVTDQQTTISVSALADFFNQTDRGVSHGCVRVEKPFELAKFILKDKDEKFFENLNYCMTADSLTEKKRIIGSVKVKPALPLFLTYYTLYPLNGEKKSGWVSYPDVYGYDKVIYDFLMRNYR